MTDTTTETSRLQNYPITFLAIPLGLAGFTLAVQKGSEYFCIPYVTSTVLLLAAKALFSILIFHITANVFLRNLAVFELIIFSGIILVLIVRTAKEIAEKRICVSGE